MNKNAYAKVIYVHGTIECDVGVGQSTGRFFFADKVTMPCLLIYKPQKICFWFLWGSLRLDLGDQLLSF